MNRNNSAYSFLLECLIAILFFILCALVSVKIYVTSGIEVNLALQKRKALEYVTDYIESGNYQPDEYDLDEGFNESENGIYHVSIQFVDKESSQMEITVLQGEEILVVMPFYGGEYEH